MGVETNKKALKERIVSVAHLEFTSNGYKATKMDVIAKNLGISKRTLYEYFSTKETLFEAVIMKQLTKAQGRIDEVICSIKNQKDVNLIDEIMNISQVVTDGIYIFKQMFEDMRTFTPHIWDIIEQFRMEQVRTNFDIIFDMGIEQGIFKPGVIKEIVYLMHLSAVREIINPEIISELPYSSQEVLACIYDVMFTGVLTEEAQKEYCLKSCIILK